MTIKEEVGARRMNLTVNKALGCDKTRRHNS